MQDESTKHKLLVLFVMEKFETPISEDLLLTICCIDNGWIPYLYCKQVVNELIKSAFISRSVTPGDNSSLLSITADGRSCIAYFYNDIPLSLQTEITTFIKENRITYRKKQEFVCDYFRNNDGTFTVALKIQDPSKVLLDLKIVVDSRALATSIKNSWGHTAPEVYKTLHDILLES